MPGPDSAPLLEDVRVITLLDDQGQCRAVNAAVAMTNTPWVFITNDDHIYKPDWFEKLTDDLPEEVMCVSPQLIEPRDGAPSFIKYFCGGVGGDWNKEKWLKYEHKSQGIRRGFNFPILVKRELWDLVNGYDIRYDPWGASSDTDLQCKFELAGAKTYQNTNCPVYHYSNTSDTFHPRNSSFWHENYNYFREKWGYERPGDPDVWFSKDLIDYDKLKFKPFWKGFYEKD